jgi:hypothetical protein
MNFHDLNEIFVDFHSFVWIFMDFNDFVRAFFVRVGCFVRVPLSASFVLFGCSYSLSIFVRVFYSGISCFVLCHGFVRVVLFGVLFILFQSHRLAGCSLRKSADPEQSASFFLRKCAKKNGTLPTAQAIPIRNPKGAPSPT